MKPHFTFCALVISAFLARSPGPAVAAEQGPLQPMAESICELATPFPTSKLFELFELDVPFLILTDGSEMLAAQAKQCNNFRPVENESFFLVLGHRNKKGTATFFMTSLRGELIQAARGLATTSGDIDFTRVEPSDEIRSDFEAAKTFWLTWCRFPE